MRFSARDRFRDAAHLVFKVAHSRSRTSLRLRLRPLTLVAPGSIEKRAQSRRPCPRHRESRSKQWQSRPQQCSRRRRTSRRDGGRVDDVKALGIVPGRSGKYRSKTRGRSANAESLAQRKRPATSILPAFHGGLVTIDEVVNRTKNPIGYLTEDHKRSFDEISKELTILQRTESQIAAIRNPRTPRRVLLRAIADATTIATRSTDSTVTPSPRSSCGDEGTRAPGQLGHLPAEEGQRRKRRRHFRRCCWSPVEAQGSD
jgi:hypothetical protein